VNLGRSGDALCRQKPDYPERVLAENPDAVVIQWGVNDQYWGYSVAQFAIAYEKLVAALRSARPRMPIVLTTLVADFRYKECFDRWIGQANVMIQETAARHGCRVAYIHKAIGHDRKPYYADTIHPNDAGAKVMAQAICEAFQRPPLSKKHLQVLFDQGEEVRFLQYVLIPDREDQDPHWISVTDISRDGMTVVTELPMTVRTAPIYPKGSYLIEVKDALGEVLLSKKSAITWQKILSFRLAPGSRKQPLAVSIRRLADD